MNITHTSLVLCFTTLVSVSLLQAAAFDLVPPKTNKDMLAKQLETLEDYKKCLICAAVTPCCCFMCIGVTVDTIAPTAPCCSILCAAVGTYGAHKADQWDQPILAKNSAAINATMNQLKALEKKSQ